MPIAMFVRLCQKQKKCGFRKNFVFLKDIKGTLPPGGCFVVETAREDSKE